MVSTGMRRRVFLRVIAAGAVPAAAGCAANEELSPVSTPPSVPRFFTADERAALSALADLHIPPDDTPGASALGAVEYIERLLTAFEHPGVPRIFTGGPFSGRNPYPDAAGAPSKKFPPDAFTTWLPLDRYAEAQFRLYIHGSAGLPNGGPNDAALGPIVGLRDLFREGIAGALKAAGKPLDELDAATLMKVYDGLSSDFQDALLTLVTEGVFAAPEYGGNVGLGGWKLANHPGDVLPLGYSFYDEASGTYKERADMPVTTADPGPDPAPFDMETLAKLEQLVMLTGGMKFS
jgi:hypothetical protein